MTREFAFVENLRSTCNEEIRVYRESRETFESMFDDQFGLLTRGRREGDSGAKDSHGTDRGAAHAYWRSVEKR